MAYCEPCIYLKKVKVEAKYKCIACKEIYCHQCNVDHSKFRAFRNHEVTMIADSEVKGANENSDLHEEVDGFYSYAYTKGYVGKNNDKSKGIKDREDLELNPTDAQTQPVDAALEDKLEILVEFLDSDLSRKIGIQRRKCLIKINDQHLSVVLDADKEITFQHSLIRRYGITKGQLDIEIGRKCMYGEGILKINSNYSMEIKKALDRTIEAAKKRR